MPLQLCNKSYSGDNLSVSIPPAAHNLSACVKHSHTKFMPYKKPSAIKICFAEKSLGRQSVNDITLEDAQVVKSLIYLLMGLSERAFQKALAMKEDDQELRQLHALTTAWEIEAINHQRDFLLVMQEEETQFIWSTKDLQLFKDIMECCSVSQLEEQDEYHIGAYGQDLMLLALEDEHLSQMEEVTGKLEDNKVLDSKDNLMAFLATSINVDERMKVTQIKPQSFFALSQL
ncbi:hypothetical protein F5J12DRAFT_896142 [Pisolithus orientalis]|uniref:uncharacterized protein n=1 Tax=Pisolithus orientalis TaxID=936130 RepID=UPI0022241B04|nr:uncharacterized protein F5J12DRAFT_896142 [Pisolithus orientalis]KAI5996613.1 hypothetical protein F5J12DRAFT_896142 [Pisolithus orientalis]